MKLAGLSVDQVAASRARHGVNVLAPPERDPWWKEFLSKFEDPIICILMIAAVISFGVGALEHKFSYESLGIVVAILQVRALTFWNEHKANAEFDVLFKVMRVGGIMTAGRDTVVGDVVF